MKLFRTKAYKTTMGFIYGWGATAVIVGALFKIMHFPGAGIVLTVGMLVEAAIFFLSAFEPPMEHYNWTRVFPQLGKSHSDNSTNPSVRNNLYHSLPGQSFSQLDEQDAEDLKKGIRKIVDAADSFAVIARHAPEVNEKINQLSETFDRLNSQTFQMGDALTSSAQKLVSGCDEMRHVMSDSVKEMTEEIENTFGKIKVGLAQSGEEFVVMGKLLEEQNRNLKHSSEVYSQSFALVNRHIATLNALYELQIKQTGDSVELLRKFNGESVGILHSVSEGRRSVSHFREQSEELAHRVTSLNEVYGNMLSLVNHN